MYDLVYFCDSYPGIGLGHLSRGIDICNAFIEKNQSSVLSIKGKFHDDVNGFIRERLNPSITVLGTKEVVHCKVGILDTMFYKSKQSINHTYVSHVKSQTKKLIFLWDAIEVKLPKEVDIYINHLPYAITEKYRDDQKIFLGLSYLPAQNKYYYSNDYNVKGDLLFIIGGSDETENLEIFINKIRKLSLYKTISMIFSPSYNYNFIELLKKKYTDIRILQNVDDLMPYFNKAAAIVTTYGNTTFQVLAAKRPVFTFGLVEFQEFYGKKLEETGYSVNLGLFSKLNLQKLTYLTNDNFLEEKQKLLSEIFIEPGIKNIIKIIKNELG